MRHIPLLFAFSLCLSFCLPAFSQFDFDNIDIEGFKPPAISSDAEGETEKEVRGPRIGKSQVQEWQFGAILTARDACSNILILLAVPMDWPEQKIRLVDQELHGTARFSFRPMSYGASQMVIRIPDLPANQSAKAVLTVEVTRYELLEPSDPSIYVIPQFKTVPKELKPYLGTSPKIESDKKQFATLFNEITEADGLENDWQKIEAIYDYVRKEVRYTNVTRDKVGKGAVQTLKDKVGDCKDMCSLFIAICRAGKVPARIVWVYEHCYAEFYLEDDAGEGYWFPAQLAGTRAFGCMPEFRPILQKGDNFYVPEFKERKTFLSEDLSGTFTGRPPQKPEYIREIRAK